MENGGSGWEGGPASDPTEVDEARLARIVSVARAAARQAELEEQREILAEIEKLNKEKPGGLGNLLFLAASLAAFFYLGLFAWGWGVLLMVIPVLLIHEMGHYLGMKIFGYADVRMFFIPLFGGAVSGRSLDVPGYKRGIVALLGPLPGLLAGLACLLVHARTQQNIWLLVAKAFLLINGFNLLPIYPLDGGHLLGETLFCRSRYIELVVRIASGALLTAIALALGLWMLAIPGVLVALFSSAAFKEAGAADRLRGTLAPEALGSSTLPPEAAGEVIAEVRRTYPGTEDPKIIAMKADGIWERLRARPPGPAATLALMLVYALSLLSVLALGAWALSSGAPAPH